MYTYFYKRESVHEKPADTSNSFEEASEREVIEQTRSLEGVTIVLESFMCLVALLMLGLCRLISAFTDFESVYFSIDDRQLKDTAEEEEPKMLPKTLAYKALYENELEINRRLFDETLSLEKKLKYSESKSRQMLDPVMSESDTVNERDDQVPLSESYSPAGTSSETAVGSPADPDFKQGTPWLSPILAPTNEWVAPGGPRLEQLPSRLWSPSFEANELRTASFEAEYTEHLFSSESQGKMKDFRPLTDSMGSEEVANATSSMPLTSKASWEPGLVSETPFGLSSFGPPSPPLSPSSTLHSPNLPSVPPMSQAQSPDLLETPPLRIKAAASVASEPVDSPKRTKQSFFTSLFKARPPKIQAASGFTQKDRHEQVPRLESDSGVVESSDRSIPAEGTTTIPTAQDESEVASRPTQRSKRHFDSADMLMADLVRGRAHLKPRSKVR